MRLYCNICQHARKVLIMMGDTLADGSGVLQGKNRPYISPQSYIHFAIIVYTFHCNRIYNFSHPMACSR